MRSIALLAVLDVLEHSCGAADCDDENAGRERIERPAVADPLHAHQPPNASDDVV